jgi:hypothetical protein
MRMKYIPSMNYIYVLYIACTWLISWMTDRIASTHLARHVRYLV